MQLETRGLTPLGTTRPASGFLRSLAHITDAYPLSTLFERMKLKRPCRELGLFRVVDAGLQSNAGTRISHEFNSSILECTSNFLNCIKMRADRSTP